MKMKALDFASTLKKIAKDCKTLYVYGSIGAHLRSDNIQRYIKKYPYNQKPKRLEKINESLDKGIFGFDCVCLVKSVLWGWCGDLDANYGGAVYKSNSVPDINANKMIEACHDISEDFSGLSIGEFLWMQDHCGIYVGDGLAVECTPLWQDGVQITSVGNLPSAPSSYHQRKWVKHGKLPYVDYSNEEKTSPITNEAKAPSQNKPSLTEILRRILRLILSFFKA